MIIIRKATIEGTVRASDYIKDGYDSLNDRTESDDWYYRVYVA